MTRNKTSRDVGRGLSGMSEPELLDWVRLICSRYGPLTVEDTAYLYAINGELERRDRRDKARVQKAVQAIKKLLVGPLL